MYKNYYRNFCRILSSLRDFDRSWWMVAYICRRYITRNNSIINLVAPCIHRMKSFPMDLLNVHRDCFHIRRFVIITKTFYLVNVKRKYHLNNFELMALKSDWNNISREASHQFRWIDYPYNLVRKWSWSIYACLCGQFDVVVIMQRWCTGSLFVFV